MSLKNMTVFCAALCFFLYCVSIQVGAQTQNAFDNPIVVNVENGKIFVNKGFYENIGNDQTFTVTRGNKTIAKLKVIELYEHYCICEISETNGQGAVEKGDIARIDAKEDKKDISRRQLSKTTLTADKEEQKKINRKEAEQSIAIQKKEEQLIREAKKREEQLKKEAEAAEKKRLQEREERKQQIQDEYIEELADCTRVVSFNKRSGPTLFPNPIKLLQGYSLYRYLEYTFDAGSYNWAGGRWISVPNMIYGMATNLTHDNHRANKAAKKDANIDIEILFYTPELIRSQARMFAAKDDQQDNYEQVQAIANGLRQQLELDAYAVFQVTISNKNSDVPIQLAPFKWKMSLITSSNEQIKAVKYDEALDKTLGPNQTTYGNVYFPLTDSQGVQLGIQNVKVKLESILDKKIEISWLDEKGRPKTPAKSSKKKTGYSSSKDSDAEEDDAQTRKQRFNERYNNDTYNRNRR